MKHPKEVIIHVGTNDISTKSPTEIIKSVSGLGEAIMTEDPAIDLTFSELVLRNDDKGFADKVNSLVYSGASDFYALGRVVLN
jgi:hypothetical protein